MNIHDVVKWRDDAIADGWSYEPTYGAGEPIEYACTLRRDAFQVQIITRPKGARSHEKAMPYPKDIVSLAPYGPDGLYIKPPEVYSFQQLYDNLFLCTNCNTYNEQITRVGFAGRVCYPCREILAPSVEAKGWTD